MIARLKRRSEFLRIARAQTKWVTPGLILQIRKRSPADNAAADTPAIRVGFTVSRKVGGAVQRNRAKRRLRVVAERLLSAHAAPGYDYVIIGRRGTLTRAFDALGKDLESALKRLDVYMDIPLHHISTGA